MYTPPAFREDDPAEIRRIIREARLSTLVTATAEGLIATPLPLILDESEGELGVLYGHLAKANPQWKLAGRWRGAGHLFGAGRLGDAELVRGEEGADISHVAQRSRKARPLAQNE